MAKEFQNIQIPFFREGIVRSAELAETVSMNSSVQRAVNWNFDSTGAIQTRKGLSQYVAANGGPIITLGQFAENATSNRRLLSQVGNKVYAWDGTTNTLVRTMSSSNKARFCQFSNYTYMVNGTTGGDPLQSYNGTTFGTTNVAALPKGDYIETFENRLVVADVAGDDIYFTDVVQPNGTLTGGGTNPLHKLSPGNGQKITALKTVGGTPGAMLVFKENSIYRVYSLDPDNPSIDPYPAYNVGTYSNESIVEMKDGIYFFHSTGFYKFSFGGQPIEISRRISDVIRGISRESYEDVRGWRDQDGNQIYWKVGDLNLPEGRIENAILRYTVSSQVWTIYSHKSPVTAAIVYDDGTDILPLIGYKNTGIIAQYNNGLEDLGDPIFVDIVTRSFILTESYSRIKQIDKASAISTNGAGLNVAYQKDKTTGNKWEPIGKITEEFVTPLPIPDALSFNQIAFRIFGALNGTPAYVYGIELLYADEEGYRSN